MNGLYRGRPRRDSGLSLVELMVALGVIAVALFSLVAMILNTTRGKQAQRDQALAKQAATAKLEEMRAQTFNQIFARYNTTPADDPGGVGTSPGAFFTVDGLPFTWVHPTFGAQIRGRGTITFALDAVGTPLNPNLLDVTVTIDWTRVGGKSNYILRSLFSK